MAGRKRASKTPQIIIITGLSGSGKGTALKAFEDLGYFSVDNLPVELLPKFGELVKDSPNIRSAALVIDIREGAGLQKFPAIYKRLKKQVRAMLLFLEANDDVLVRRFSETRRPHPLGKDQSVSGSLDQEREALSAIRALADHVIDSSQFNVHDLRHTIQEKFEGGETDRRVAVYVTSFGFRHGLPTDSDLVFDVRFLPNPNYMPEFKNLTGNNPSVARYIRSFPQTGEFIDKISELLVYLLPHYMREGKSYLTIAFGCTGGQHRSVMIANEVRKRLARTGLKVRCTHRDAPAG